MLSPRTGRGNRYGLAFVGVVLVAGGLFCIGQDRNMWVAGSSHQPLLTGAEGRFAHNQDWLWVAAALLAAVVALVCLRWLVVQTRRANLGDLRFESDAAHGQSQVAARTVARAVEDELANYPEVSGAHAEITAGRNGPELRLALSTSDPDLFPRLRERVETETVAHACTALGAESLPVYLTLGIS